MIEGFEEITHDLKDHEVELAHRMIPFLKSKTKDNPVKSEVIVNGINTTWKVKPKLTGERLRKIVNYLRSESILPIISTKNGYFVSYDEEDINYQIRQGSQRASSVMNSVYGMARILKKIKEK